MIDTHSHIYSEEFDSDREEVIERAVAQGVTHFVLPAIDKSCHTKLFEVAERFANHYPTIGVHPTSVKENFMEELEAVQQLLVAKRKTIVAIGEIGLDYYWDRTFVREQEIAVRRQLEWAVEEHLPVIIHTRNSCSEMLDLLSDYKGTSLRTVFHCYSGTMDEADRLLSLGDHLLGIGGVVTFKKSGLGEIVREVGLEHIVLETDAPYLAPTPHRGKRNESSYIPLIVKNLAQLLEKEEIEIDVTTTINAKKFFKL